MLVVLIFGSLAGVPVWAARMAGLHSSCGVVNQKLKDSESDVSIQVRTFHIPSFDIYTDVIDLKLSANYSRCFDYEAKVNRLCEKLGVTSILWAMLIGHPDPKLLEVHNEYRFAVPPTQVAGYVNERTWRPYVEQKCDVDSRSDYASAPKASWEVSVLLKTPIEKESYLLECRRCRTRGGEFAYEVISCPWSKRHGSQRLP